MKYIVTCEDFAPDDLYEIGGKAAALAALSEHLLPIPAWFTVKVNAYQDSPGGAFGSDFARELEDALDAFPADTYFAVRSSARAEDGAAASFAGQFETYLWVSRADVPARIRDVWASAFSQRVRVYSKQSGLKPPTEPPAVLVQKMVRSERAGVAFAADPLHADTGTCVISAVFGLGSALVDGSSDADTYTFHYQSGAVTADVAHKSPGAEPLNREINPHIDESWADRRVLGDTDIADIAALARQTSQLFGRFQDIEWAYEGDTLYLLQSRPITTLAGVFEGHARAFVFDNSNIAESYRHTTTPLTFSFIRKAYAGVYEQFCRVFGVSEAVIEENAAVFTRMLALLDSRVYYNLHAWYKMLSLLPGYALNRTFMEQMMGVKEPLPEDFLKEIHDSVPSVGRLTDSLRLLRCIIKLIGNYIKLESHIAAFYRRLDAALEGPPPAQLDANGLMDAFAAMEKSLLKRWDAPIENDFFAMIFHGLLRALSKKYGLPEDFHNALLTGQGGIISARPAAEIRQIGAMIASDARAVDTLSTGSLRDINRLLSENAPLREKTEAYLGMFGDRCVDELKLESITLTENPLSFYRAVAAMASQKGDFTPPDAPDWHPYFRGHPLRRALFGWVLKTARRTVKNRENLRFDRTRLFGRVRAIFLQMGLEFASRGIIEDRRDIFYLTLDEIFGALDATGVSADLRGMAALRKAEFMRNDAGVLPTRVYVNGIADFSGRRFGGSDDTAPTGDLTGLPCCAGVVEARARVVTDPQKGDFKKGDILVARTTDPGWIVLFSLASGIIAEKGSLLSHAAIVSREMGIPCIVSATGATAAIPDGALVRMDGAAGTIIILEEEENHG